MCGIAGSFGENPSRDSVEAMVAVQHHRGPDASGIFESLSGKAILGHNRLSIIDLSSAGQQPMSSWDGRYWIVFNGEIYNYLELREQLRDYQYRSRTDTEVILAAYERWGDQCLDRFTGMFAFMIWDEREQKLFAARDRFGVKPLNYHHKPDGTLLVASEIKALHAAGVPMEPDSASWATYLTHGLYDYSSRTFWRGISSLPGGHKLFWQNGNLTISSWYELSEHTGVEWDLRSDAEVREEYLSLLKDSVRIRFRSDVPVGVSLSGGLDSSTLLGLVHAIQGPESDVKTYTYTTREPEYDELPWVRRLLAGTNHPSIVYRLDPDVIPEVADSVFAYEDEPYGGLPTVAYAPLLDRARSGGVIVLLEGQGMDEQWAGYDYYRSTNGPKTVLIQGSNQPPYRPLCLNPDFREMAEAFVAPEPFPDRLRNLQYRDILYTKMPKALRFNDRVSMRSSIELRDPFLDHRLFELALRQPSERKIANGRSKILLREVAADLLPNGIVDAPKRPLQTPQREWLRGPLRHWVNECIERALSAYGGNWLIPDIVRAEWRDYCERAPDNSFYIWQWVSLGLMVKAHTDKSFCDASLRPVHANVP